MLRKPNLKLLGMTMIPKKTEILMEKEWIVNPMKIRAFKMSQ